MIYVQVSVKRLFFI